MVETNAVLRHIVTTLLNDGERTMLAYLFMYGGDSIVNRAEGDAMIATYKSYGIERPMKLGSLIDYELAKSTAPSYILTDKGILAAMLCLDSLKPHMDKAKRYHDGTDIIGSELWKQHSHDDTNIELGDD